MPGGAHVSSTQKIKSLVDNPDPEGSIKRNGPNSARPGNRAAISVLHVHFNGSEIGQVDDDEKSTSILAEIRKREKQNRLHYAIVLTIN